MYISQCQAPATAVAASDDRVDQIEGILSLMRDYSPKARGTPAMAELLISLYEQERLWGEMFEPYFLASIAYNAAGEGWTALKYARLAVEAGMLWPGPVDPEFKDMELMLNGPTTHWSWALRTHDVK